MLKAFNSKVYNLTGLDILGHLPGDGGDLVEGLLLHPYSLCSGRGRDFGQIPQPAR